VERISANQITKDLISAGIEAWKSPDMFGGGGVEII
jgi:hypothetical protein